MSLYQRADRIAALVAAVFTLASLVLVLVLPSDILLSASNTDMVSEFASWRAYLADKPAPRISPALEFLYLRRSALPRRFRISGALSAKPALSLPAPGSCAQFFDTPPSRDPRMGNRTMGHLSWAQSMGGRSGWGCHASFRSGLSPYLRGPSFKPLYHGLGTVDFSGTRNVDMAGQSPGTIPRKCGNLSPDIGWSYSVFFLYGRGGRNTVARSFGGGTHGASPSTPTIWRGCWKRNSAGFRTLGSCGRWRRTECSRRFRGMRWRRSSRATSFTCGLKRNVLCAGCARSTPPRKM